MAYVALHGRSVWATLNTYYSVLKETEFKPKHIWLCTEVAYEDQLSVLDEGFRIISMGYDLKPKVSSMVVPEGDIIEAGLEIGGLISSLQTENIVALDITSARKALVVGSILATADKKPDNIFYLMIDTLDDISKPYCMIPLQHQKLVDLRGQSRRYRK
ncbi:MAG: hypothetical protein ACTSRU_19925 [Candidatus Hodarchaeales archaeon]